MGPGALRNRRAGRADRHHRCLRDPRIPAAQVIGSESYKFLGNMRSFNDTFESRITAWVNDLKNKTPYDKVDAKAEDALRAQRVIEAAIESFEKGTVVELKN
jgi:predicted dehydrogenase